MRSLFTKLFSTPRADVFEGSSEPLVGSPAWMRGEVIYGCFGGRQPEQDAVDFVSKLALPLPGVNSVGVEERGGRLVLVVGVHGQDPKKVAARLPAQAYFPIVVEASSEIVALRMAPCPRCRRHRVEGRLCPWCEQRYGSAEQAPLFREDDAAMAVMYGPPPPQALEGDARMEGMTMLGDLGVSRLEAQLGVQRLFFREPARVIRPTRIRGVPLGVGALLVISGESGAYWLADVVTREGRLIGLSGHVPKRDVTLTHPGRSVLGLGDVDADISTSTEGVFANGFLRGLLKLAVPVLVIGAGVALGHRWAGITREGNRRRNGKRRRRNPPYRVKGMAATLADARKAYDLLPAGYRSIVDHQAGRSYKKRKVVAESRRPR